MIIDPKFRLSLDRPRFIVFEGGNGAGKSTLLQNIAAYLLKAQKKVVTTREPGGTPLGKKLRTLLQESPDLLISSTSELYLFAADRHEHVEKVIRPSLKAGSWVLSDRYLYSTLAFQGYGRGLSLDLIDPLMKQAVGGVYPDLVVLVDIEAEKGLTRIKSRAEIQEDKFEQESLEFHRKVREGFLEIARKAPEPFLVLSGELSPEELVRETVRVLA